jgi:hypothetical protein
MTVEAHEVEKDADGCEKESTPCDECQACMCAEDPEFRVHYMNCSLYI